MASARNPVTGFHRNWDQPTVVPQIMAGCWRQRFEPDHAHHTNGYVRASYIPKFMESTLLFSPLPCASKGPAMNKMIQNISHGPYIVLSSIIY